MKKYSLLLVLAAVLALCFTLVIACGPEEEARGGARYYGSFVAVDSDNYIKLWDGADLTMYSDEDTTSVFSVDGATGNLSASGTLAVTGNSTLSGNLTVGDGVLSQDLNVENLGALPSVITVTLPYTPSSGALVTVTDGEIWLVESVLYKVDTNFDCTGDDCTVDVGDSNDVDGFVDAADANLQTTFADYTGAQAGWGALDGSAPRGAYQVGGPHIYAPSGADETIDYAVGGTDPAAGSMTVYLKYYRLQ